MKNLWMMAALLAMMACASAGRLSLRPGYDFKRTRIVALLPFKEADQLPESGAMAANMVAQTLLQAGLAVVDRGRVEAVLRERRIDRQDALAGQGLRDLGKALGADAVVLGSVTALIREENTQVRSSGHRKVLVRREGRFVQVRADGPTTPGELRLFETEGDVSLDVMVRMMLVSTGEIVWIVTGEAERRGFSHALEAVLGPVLEKLKRRITASLAGKKQTLEESAPQPEIKGWTY